MEMNNHKNGSLAGIVATAVLLLLMVAVNWMMLELDHVVILRMLMGSLLLIGLTRSFQNWQTGVVRRLYSTNPGSSDIVKSLT